MRRLSCHIVDCPNECLNVSAAVPNPKADELEYLCDPHIVLFGAVMQEPWQTELDNEQIAKLARSRPYRGV